MAQQGNLDSLVRESLRGKIINGELDGGFHLSELKISKEYNVSRTPVREALCALAADGLVEMVPHRGAFVTHSAPQTKTDQLQAYTLFMGLAAKLAAEKANIEMLMDLETAFSFTTGDEKMSTQDYLANFETALDLVERVANSPTISEAIGMIKRRANLTEFWAHAASNRKDMNQQMNLLLTALKRKKADTAEKSMRQIAQTVANSYLAQRRSPAAAQAETAHGAELATKKTNTTHTAA
jgi:DNA-binding GntR family transcriptional regulator